MSYDAGMTRIVTSTSRRLLVVSLCALIVAGCGINAQPVPREPPVINIAVGADVALELTYPSCNSGPAEACLYEVMHEVEDVVIEGEEVAELVDYSVVDAWTVRVDVRARAVGEATLAVVYSDVFDDRYQDRFVLRVSDIDRVEVEIYCDGDLDDAGPFPVLAGSPFHFRTSAWAGESQLATGLMELVSDFGDFEVLDELEEPDDLRSVVAPDQAGVYTWELLGDDSVSPELVIFDDSALDLEIAPAEDASEEGLVVTVGRLYEGAPVCAYEGESLIHVEVTSGECRPVVNGVEILGRFPIILGEDGLSLPFAGHDTCVIEATLEGGDAFEATVVVDAGPPEPAPGSGERLGPTPVESDLEVPQHDDCERVVNLTNGTCEITDAAGIILPDVDCLLDWEWEMHHYDPLSGDELEGGVVGVGLLTELHLTINYELLFFDVESHPPTDLTVTSTPGEDVTLDGTGCIDEWAVLAVTTRQARDYDLSFGAGNVYDPGRFTLRAREVAEVRFSTSSQEAARDDPESLARFFVGSSASIYTAYADSAGAALGGQARFLASCDDASGGATIQGATVDTGTTPQIITVASEIAPQTLEIRVVGGEAIGEIGGLEPQTFSIGENQCLAPVPLTTAGTAIHGVSPVRPVLQMTGDDALVVDADPFPPPPSGEICFARRAAGTVVLEVAWGAATGQSTWTVVE
jgi:hypothetical protein